MTRKLSTSVRYGCAALTLAVISAIGSPGGAFAQPRQTVAKAASVPLGGWVVVRQPVGGPATPLDQYNSTGGANSIVRDGPGSYSIRFKSLAAVPDRTVPGSAGVAHVTPFGNDPAQCAVKSYGPSGGDEVVDVRCVKIGSATLVDVPFTVTFSRVLGQTTNDYRGFVVADRPGSAQYRPVAEKALNLVNGVQGSRPLVERASRGRYFVTFSGAQADRRDAGQIALTAMGAGAGGCVLGPGSLAVPDVVVGVRCFDSGGTLDDSPFLLSLVSRASLAPAPSATYGYQLNGTPTQSPSYNWVQSTSYAGRAYHTTDNAAPEALSVLLPGAGADADKGVVHTVAHESSEYRHCQPRSWGRQLSDVVISIVCVDHRGRPAYYIGDHLPKPVAVSYQSRKGV